MKTFLYNLITILSLAAITGCGPLYTQVHTRAVRAETTPVSAIIDSDSPADACQARRSEQRATRRAEYCAAGITQACTTTPATDIDYHAAVEAVCRTGLIETAECERLRTAPMPHGTTVAVPATVTTASPEALEYYRYLNDPIVWSDIEAVCASRSMGYAYGGGYGGYGGYGMGYGPTCGAGAICGGNVASSFAMPVMPVAPPIR